MPEEPAHRRVFQAPDGIKRERRAVFFLPITLWVAASFVMSSIIAGLLEPLLAYFDVSPVSIDRNLYTSLIGLLVYVLLLLITLGVPKLMRLWSARIPYRRLFGLTHQLQWREILFGVLGFAVYLAVYVAVSSFITSHIPGFDPDLAQDTGYSKILSPQSLIAAFVSLVIVAPVAEEIIFRGYLFGSLRRTLPVWGAAFVTSALFAAAHLGITSPLHWNVAVDVFLMSFVSCYLRYRTGSLWASILLHMLKNGLAFYILYIAGTNL